MHLSPNLKAAVWNARRYEQQAESLQPRHGMASPDDPPERASPPTRTRPDYGCVEWYFYDERGERRRGV